MIAETEQWLLNGYCNKCRRVGYCRKECTIKKKIAKEHDKKLLDMQKDVRKAADEFSEKDKGEQNE